MSIVVHLHLHDHLHAFMRLAHLAPVRGLRDPAAVRADRGAATLDRWMPGWALHVSRPVKVESALDCPLGQTYGSYSVAPAVLVWESVAYGFLPITHADVRALNACWKAEIARRRFDDAVADLAVDERGSSPARRRFEAATAP